MYHDCSSKFIPASRKDKYQAHIIEYWVDVRTSGSLSRSTKEEFNQCVEIIDSGASLPPPTLGDEALPFYDVEDDDDEDDDQDDEDGDEGNDTTSGTPSTRRKSRRKTSKKTPSPKSKILARKKKEKGEGRSSGKRFGGSSD